MAGTRGERLEKREGTDIITLIISLRIEEVHGFINVTVYVVYADNSGTEPNRDSLLARPEHLAM